MSDFEGISPRSQTENYTQVPNEVFDNLMKQMSGTQFKIYCAIIRKTYGWIERADENGNAVYKVKDDISITDFMKITGLSRPTITKNLQKLLDDGFIVQVKKGNVNNTK
jgi:DNA-binding MarR family transcriptional regulator